MSKIRWMMPLALSLATVVNEAGAAEAIPVKPEAALQAVVVRVIEQAPRASIRESHLGATAEISASDRFDQISHWFEKLNDRELEELQSRHSHESLREALIRLGFPAPVSREVTEAFSQFFKEPQSQVIIKQLQQLPDKEFKHLQDLAKHYLETNSREARRDLVKALREAGITVDPSVLTPFYIFLCLAGAVMAVAVGRTAILNSTKLSIRRGTIRSTHTEMPVVGTGKEEDAGAKKTGDKPRPKDRPERPDRGPKPPPGPSPREIAALVDEFHEQQKRRRTG